MKYRDNSITSKLLVSAMSLPLINFRMNPKAATATLCIILLDSQKHYAHQKLSVVHDELYKDNHFHCQ